MIKNSANFYLPLTFEGHMGNGKNEVQSECKRLYRHDFYVQCEICSLVGPVAELKERERKVERGEIHEISAMKTGRRIRYLVQYSDLHTD